MRLRRTRSLRSDRRQVSRRFCFGVVLLLLIAVWQTHAGAKSPGPGTEAAVSADERFKSDLISVITRSDRIVVTEHAFEAGPGGEVDLDNQKIYASKELDAKQKARFLASIKAMNARVQEAVEGADACAFEPHHAIQFMLLDRSIGTLEVSFECAEIFWEGSHGDVPAALPATLEKLVTRIGLTPRRDWNAL